MAQARDSWLGKTIGNRFVIAETVGQGRTGPVYRARDSSEGRDVAVKLLKAPPSQDEQWVQDFIREAKACSVLTHPNTGRVYDAGKTRLGQIYLVSELLPGRSLTSIILSEPPMSPSRVLRILMQLCASLDEAHALGIFHGNIGSEKVMVQRQEGATDSIKLFGFSMGIRSHLDVRAGGPTMDSQHFMSPEQGQGGHYDQRSDFYALGVLAYAMLCGRLPFQHDDPKEVLRMHREVEVPALPEAVPGALSMMVMACLEKQPDRRPPSAGALSYACKIGLRELDPGLDLARDPVLKKTMIHRGSDTVLDDAPSFSGPVGPMRTMLGAVGPGVDQGAPNDVVNEVSHTSPTRIDDSDQNPTILRDSDSQLDASETMANFPTGKGGAVGLTNPPMQSEAPKDLALRPSGVKATAKTAHLRPSAGRRLALPDQLDAPLAQEEPLPFEPPRSSRGLILVLLALASIALGAYFSWSHWA